MSKTPHSGLLSYHCLRLLFEDYLEIGIIKASRLPTYSGPSEDLKIRGCHDNPGTPSDESPGGATVLAIFKYLYIHF